MTERDLGSTFLLPHTHLYKPDRVRHLKLLTTVVIRLCSHRNMIIPKRNFLIALEVRTY